MIISVVLSGGVYFGFRCVCVYEEWYVMVIVIDVRLRIFLEVIFDVEEVKFIFGVL